VPSILPDTNVWLALALSGHHHHGAARDWLATIDEPASIFFCRATQQSLLRLLTNTTVFGAYGNAPLTNRRAWEVFSALLEDDRIRLRVDEPPGLEVHWRELALRDSASPKLWMDAYLAAFTRAGHCKLVTTDAAFRQFPGLDLLVLQSA
jgi:toxin-antitoxin system PIN domain toxin